MILVTQGHEQGVGLEIFIKAFLCLNKTALSQFKLFTTKSALENTLKTLNLNFKITSDQLIIGNKSLSLHLFSSQQYPESTLSLKFALNEIQKNDILLTLPTSKDQLWFQDKKVNGYTEYFRKEFKKSYITMNFLSHNQNVLLLSDHISVSEISILLKEKLIIDKVSTTLDNLTKLRRIKDIYFAGIDPHCGEGGQISNLDIVLDTAIYKLQKLYPQFQFYGPLPADTLHFKFEDRTDQLFVYPAHDQGLGPFKLKNGLIGINLSLGLPFIRVSVDHGTAFDLYGKNKANYLSMLYLLEEIQKWT